MNAETAEELRKECETLQMIKHPNLLIFYGAGTADDGRSFMVTEFLAGGSLRAVLHDASREIEWNLRQRVAVHVAAGMQHLHSLSIVHRDLKSDNVLVDRELNAKVSSAPSLALCTCLLTCQLTHAVCVTLYKVLHVARLRTQFDD